MKSEEENYDINKIIEMEDETSSCEENGDNKENEENKENKENKEKFFDSSLDLAQ